MGIPHLTAFLRPYAQREPLTGQDAVIDGPALCYHIYHLCLKREAHQNPLEALPSYTELGDESIAWLDGLRASDVAIRMIYFDGYLPAPKLDTRLERLRAQTRRWNDYYDANPVPCRFPVSPETTNTESLFNREPIPSSLMAIPPPFLVPAIIDALKGSAEYGSIVEMVPGEADLYCARYLKENGGIVFTGDSDLLVHDLGAHGTVGFLSEIEALPDDQSSVLYCSIFYPAAIADRLALPKSDGLLALAFEMTLDTHGTFKKLLAQATALKSASTRKNDYVEFLKEYQTLPVSALPGASNDHGKAAELVQVFQKLDPRVSEFVLQFPSLARLAGQVPSTTRQEVLSPRVFLPFLLDCPARTSAWEASTSLRQLAYGLMKHIVLEEEQEFSAFEHRRQSNLGSKGYQLSAVSATTEACEALINLLNRIGDMFPDLAVSDRWIVFVVCRDVSWSSVVGKPVRSSLAAEDLLRLRRKASGHWSYTWDMVELSAQFQGTLYSLRMLRQIMYLLVSYSGSSTLPDAVLALHGQLDSLPPFREIPDLRSVVPLVSKIEDKNMLKSAYKILGINEPVAAPLQGSSKKSKKKRKASGVQPSSSVKQGKSSNPFSVLAAE